MNKKREKINVNALVPGMVLSEDIILNHVKLLSHNTVLTDDHIQKIQKLFISSYVSVYKNKADKQRTYCSEKYLYNYEKIEGLICEISSDMEEIIKEIEYSSKPNIKKIRRLTEYILQKFNDEYYSILVKNMVMGRSKDVYLYRHSINVAVLSSMIGKWMKLSKRDLNLLTYTSVLHDIGKTKIDFEILNKPSKLTKEEFEIIKTHSTIGYNIVKRIPFLNYSVALGVLMHHEKLDGSGYPLNLKDDQIHIFAKIIAVADIFDAMTSNRVYHSKELPFKVLEMMRTEAFGKLDFNIYTTFLNNILNYYVGEMVRLNTGEVGKIIKIDINNISKPLIMINSTFIDLQKEKEITIEDLII